MTAAPSDPASDAGRYALAQRLSAAVDALEPAPMTPAYVVDLDTFDANADDLARRAAGTPIRLASKSVRVPALLERALAHPGFQGILGYDVDEAIWLVEQGICDDVVLGYPVTDPGSLGRLLDHPTAVEHVTLMIDDIAQLELLGRAQERRTVTGPVRIALDVDASLRLGPGHVGVRRSPLFHVDDVVALARAVLDRPGFSLVGVMTYEGQVAGLQDDLPTLRGVGRSLVVRRLKAWSVAQLDQRRVEIAEALAGLTDLEFWNSGGSGSIETSCVAPVTEVSAGSGLLVPVIFDHYRAFEARPAAFFGLRVARRPTRETVVVSGGGFIASGPVGADRQPLPWAPPGLRLTALEGAGEVQTPLVGETADQLALGDWVWFRHAKAGEIAVHTTTAHLVSGSAVVDSVPTYRGAGCRW